MHLANDSRILNIKKSMVSSETIYKTIEDAGYIHIYIHIYHSSSTSILFTKRKITTIFNCFLGKIFYFTVVTLAIFRRCFIDNFITYVSTLIVFYRLRDWGDGVCQTLFLKKLGRKL